MTETWLPTTALPKKVLTLVSHEDNFITKNLPKIVSNYLGGGGGGGRGKGGPPVPLPLLLSSLCYFLLLR